jgi:hypothetical protein
VAAGRPGEASPAWGQKTFLEEVTCKQDGKTYTGFQIRSRERWRNVAGKGNEMKL